MVGGGGTLDAGRTRGYGPDGRGLLRKRRVAAVEPVTAPVAATTAAPFLAASAAPSGLSVVVDYAVWDLVERSGGCWAAAGAGQLLWGRQVVSAPLSPPPSRVGQLTTPGRAASVAVSVRTACSVSRLLLWGWSWEVRRERKPWSRAAVVRRFPAAAFWRTRRSLQLTGVWAPPSPSHGRSRLSDG